MKRIEFIDQLKAVSIFFVIYIHNDYASRLTDYVGSFVLVLFLGASGYVRKNNSDLSFSQFISKSIKRLLIPYFILSLALYLFWFFVGRHYGSGENLSPLKNFLGIFYSQGGSEFIDWGIPIWFLTALFCVIFIDFFIARLQPKWQFSTIVILLLIGYYSFKLSGIHLPWSFDIAAVIYPFYYIGSLVKEKNILDKVSYSKKWVLIIITFSLHIVFSHFNPNVAMYYGMYGILPLMYINGMLGLTWVFCLFSILPTHRFVTWIGRNTLPILAFHLSAMTFIKAILLFGFGLEISHGIHYYFIYSIVQVLLLIPLILFLNKYLPFAVGIQYKARPIHQTHRTN